jgi:putative ABC transport system permease protein
MLQDLRYAVRILTRNPAFTLGASLTLALGIGVNTAMFSVVETALLRPLPFPHADELTMVWENVNLPAYRNDQNTPAPGNFDAWRSETSSFTGMAAIGYRSWSLSETGEPLRIEGEAVSAGFFPLLGVDPILGRAIVEDDDQPGRDHVAVIGYGLWTERFGADSGVVGRTIRLNDESYTVIGVMPRGFAFPDPDDRLWVPIALTPAQAANHGSHFLRVVGRLRPSMTIARAQSDLGAVSERLSRQFPDSNTGVGVRVVPLRDHVVGDVRRPLMLLLGIVGLVLVMMCANIGNLMLARALARGQELSVRTALGASRSRLLRQVLTESVLLSVIGGASGLIAAAWALDGLRALAPPGLPRTADLGLDFTAATFNFGVALLAGLACGIAPALQASRSDVAGALGAGSRVGSSRSTMRARNLMVVLETALGVVVLVGAGLLLRSFWELEHVPLGFRSAHLLTFRVVLPPARYPVLASRSAFYRRLAERLETTPGAQASAGISFLPLTFAGRSTGVSVEGQPAPAPGELRFVDFRSVTPGYFKAMGIPLIEGRDVAWSDTAETRLVIVISRDMARTFWPDQEPIGKRIKLARYDDAAAPWLTVVGVVGSVRQLDLVSRPRPAIYLPCTQDPGVGDTIRDWVVLASGDPLAAAAAVRGAVWSIDAVLPVSRVQTMERLRSASLDRQQFTLLLVTLFAALALVLAAVGVYAVTAYAVAQRTKELGIRVALGAQRTDVLKLVIGLGGRLVAYGLGVGTLLALGLARVMTTLVFGIGTRDPLTFVAVALLTIGVSLVACCLPARRAIAIDPAGALRMT